MDWLFTFLHSEWCRAAVAVALFVVMLYGLPIAMRLDDDLADVDVVDDDGTFPWIGRA